MSTIGERIARFIDETENLTRTKFAETIGISPAYVSQICSGVRVPSDRTISDICRLFKVNEDWLRTGNGEMQDVLSEDERLVEFMTDLMAESSDSFRRRFISVVSELDADGWAFLEKLADKLAQKKTDP